MSSSKDKSEYVSYKKLLIFGAESTGKSTLSKFLESGKFEDNITHTEESNAIIIIIYF